MKKISLILLTMFSLQGCIETAIVASAVTAVSSANDPRSVGSQIDDNNIELKAMVKLMKDNEISDQTNINVISYNGHVLVVGQAPTQVLIDRIESQLNEIPNITKIHNQIKIGPKAGVGSKAKDVWITTKVKTELLTDDTIKGNSIKVVTENKEVYLMGLVSPEQANKAAVLASKISGVERVIKVFQ